MTDSSFLWRVFKGLDHYSRAAIVALFLGLGLILFEVLSFLLQHAVGLNFSTLSNILRSVFSLFNLVGLVVSAATYIARVFDQRYNPSERGATLAGITVGITIGTLICAKDISLPIRFSETLFTFAYVLYTVTQSNSFGGLFNRFCRAMNTLFFNSNSDKSSEKKDEQPLPSPTPASLQIQPAESIEPTNNPALPQQIAPQPITAAAPPAKIPRPPSEDITILIGMAIGAILGGVLFSLGKSALLAVVGYTNTITFGLISLPIGLIGFIYVCNTTSFFASFADYLAKISSFAMSFCQNPSNAVKNIRDNVTKRKFEYTGSALGFTIGTAFATAVLIAGLPHLAAGFAMTCAAIIVAMFCINAFTSFFSRIGTVIDRIDQSIEKVNDEEDKAQSALTNQNTLQPTLSSPSLISTELAKQATPTPPLSIPTKNKNENSQPSSPLWAQISNLITDCCSCRFFSGSKSNESTPSRRFNQDSSLSRTEISYTPTGSFTK